MPKYKTVAFYSIEAGLPVSITLSLYLTSPKNIIYLLVEMIILILATNIDQIKHRCVNGAIFAFVRGSTIYSHLGTPCIHSDPQTLAPHSAKPQKIFCTDFSVREGKCGCSFHIINFPFSASSLFRLIHENPKPIPCGQLTFLFGSEIVLLK